jgi:hypothetical protein
MTKSGGIVAIDKLDLGDEIDYSYVKLPPNKRGHIKCKNCGCKEFVVDWEDVK